MFALLWLRAVHRQVVLTRLRVKWIHLQLKLLDSRLELRTEQGSILRNYFVVVKNAVGVLHVGIRSAAFCRLFVLEKVHHVVNHAVLVMGVPQDLP